MSLLFVSNEIPIFRGLMRKSSKRKKRILAVLIACMLVMPRATAYAGSINGPEASVIAAAGGVFTYNGKEYVAVGSAIGQLQSYLASEGLDLTDAQASEAISMMYENIQAGVEAGYLVPVDGAGGKDSNDSEKPEQESNDNTTEGTETGSKPEEDSPTEKLSPEAKAKLDELFQIENSEDDTRSTDKDEEGPLPQNLTPDEDSQDKSIPPIAWTGIGLLTVALACLAALMLKNPNIEKMSFSRGMIYSPERNCSKEYIPLTNTENNAGFTDIHCHALYGLDDGAKTMEQSLAMMKKLRQEGVKNIIFTFHAGTNSGGGRIEKAKVHLDRLRTEFTDMNLYLGNEILNGSHMQKALMEERVLTLADSRYVLVEFLPGTAYEEILQRVRRLTNAGYCPIVAHAERYSCLFGKTDRVRELIHMGGYIQINSRSFVGSRADRRAGFTIDLLRKGMVHFIADDCHDDFDRKPLMGSLYMYLLNKKRIDKKTLDRVFRENPEKILEDRPI